LLRRAPLYAPAVPSSSDEKVSQLGGNANNFIEDDSMMTRAPNGDLLLLRGVTFDNTCGNDEQTNCSWQTCPSGMSERRSGTRVWRSPDCGLTWQTNENWKIDPLKSNYGNGQYGGGPCWGGWDREEVYFDYFSNQMFVTFGGEKDTSPDEQGMFMLRSQPGGAGPFTFHRYKNGEYHQPVMMTSLPGMMFFATCEGGKPTLRWIEPDNPLWTSLAWDQPFPEGPTGMRRLQLPFTCGLDSEWGMDGSVNVSRVGTYWDDSGTQWWVVRVGVLDPPGAKIISARVNSAGTGGPLLTQIISANNPPGGQTTSRVVQLTMIEPDPSQTKPSNLPWDGENTTLYYWREEYWSPIPGGKFNPQYIIRGRALRDIAGYGPVFDITGWRTGVAGTPLGKPGDFARGGFWVDWNSPNEPLHYLVVYGDLVDLTGATASSVRAKTYRLARGMGNN
jgi:hypothetical protein